jgi:hypothetical protein
MMIIVIMKMAHGELREGRCAGGGGGGAVNRKGTEFKIPITLLVKTVYPEGSAPRRLKLGLFSLHSSGLYFVAARRV